MKTIGTIIIKTEVTLSNTSVHIKFSIMLKNSVKDGFVRAGTNTNSCII